MGYQDREYMRTDPPADEYDPPDAHAGGWWPRWQANWHARPVTATLVGLFLAVNALWFFSPERPGGSDTRQFLARHFTLDAGDAAAGRPHCHLSHALLCAGNLPHTLLMLGGLALFGTACERRVGSRWTAAAFVAATLAGGWLHLFANTPGGQADWARALDWVRGHWGDGAAGVAGELFTRLRVHTVQVGGPAAAVAAFIAVATLVRPPDGFRRENFWVAVAAAGFILIDCLGWVREAGSAVGYALRASGFTIGAIVAITASLFRRKCGGRRGRWAGAMAAVATFALPVGLTVALSAPQWAAPFAPPAFAADDFGRTCTWMERLSTPVEAGGVEVNQLKRREYVERIASEAGGIADRPVRWELPVARVTDAEIRLTPLYLVNAQSVLPIPLAADNPFLALAQLDQAGDRVFTDVRVQLTADGRPGLSVPVTADTRAYARTLTADSRVRVSATVRRIEFHAPGGDNPFEAVFAGRCGFVVHLTDVKLER